jgi:poly-gamma-glutamate capsule biosynthesis protein CapA/YwtB (metallophosphatase superfamily)
MPGRMQFPKVITYLLSGLVVLLSLGTDLPSGLPTSNTSEASKDSTLSLLFIGDIMGHGPQISSAWDDSTQSYSYHEVFAFIREEISRADLAIANLEVTLAGPPYTGYPQFSSPDELAVACMDAGIDVLGTANNHSCDRGGKGIVRTIRVLDSLGLKRTGTFLDPFDRYLRHPLTFEKNGFCLGLLNYTYGTNGLPFPDPTIVNLLDTNQIKADVLFSKALGYDMLIAFVHFGTEYERSPNSRQLAMVEFLFNQGIDLVIGSHPHVLQKMVFLPSVEDGNTRMVAYSLGNFVSNQRDRYTDGGAMVQVNLRKSAGRVSVESAGYYLTWVHRHQSEGKQRYNILPCSRFEAMPGFFEDSLHYNAMMNFVKDSRGLLESENEGVGEYRYKSGSWILLPAKSSQ